MKKIKIDAIFHDELVRKYFGAPPSNQAHRERALNEAVNRLLSNNKGLTRTAKIYRRNPNFNPHGFKQVEIGSIVGRKDRDAETVEK